MALIADLVEALKSVFRGTAETWRDLGEVTRDELTQIRDSFVVAYEKDMESAPIQVIQFLIDNKESALEFTAEALADPQQFIKETIDKWSNLLNAALEQFNVDALPGEAAERLGDPGVERQVLAELSGTAQYRVAIVVYTVNIIIGMGNGASLVAEMLSLGRIRTIAEAIQSWVWANGLGNLTSMAYQPQMGASILPILNRYYNQRSLAQVPGPGDQVRFQLREVYEPERRRELLGTDDLSTFKQFMGELGYSGYHADSYWASHWVLPSISQLNEMLHRGVIDDTTWTRFVRFNDYDPSMVPNLKEIIYSPFTRVDARRMASLGVLSDVELLQAYSDIGFFAPTAPDSTGHLRAYMVANPDFTLHKAQALVIWTKMFNALPILRARFRRGHLSPEELLQALLDTGISQDKAQDLWETVVTAEKEERTAPEKELTRGLVVRAWKMRFVSFGQGLWLLQRMGWDLAEAELILRVQSIPDDPMAFVNTQLGRRLTQATDADISALLEEE